ncbi:hypothetical protein TNIN_500651 [Trichonephila inaurata madagascariensis]|uniref:Uncharacterized protein n=1 Tax=Trichonephila inaurata madagascariensis TaxID=2747483 RepID=A0A8X6IR87_9ARAC|nr:hypothetical protein TNIN_500651 [Trichonephila inaurata madagascariensis]
MANSHRCEKYPKTKKGAASQNRNNEKNQNTFEPSTAAVQKNISFANVVKGNQQMAPPLDQSESANSKHEATPLPPREKRPTKAANDSEPFGFMDAILELKKFFQDYPSFIELGKQLRNAQGNERVDVFYRHIMSMN